MRADAGGGQYKPEPLDTSAVQLAEELKRLVEPLAEEVHDKWAGARFAMGWSYGPRIDAVLKQHPGLVPYAELSEEEKNIDRNVVIAMLSKMTALGCEVNRRRRLTRLKRIRVRIPQPERTK
jgi:hypothetical protein